MVLWTRVICIIFYNWKKKRVSCFICSLTFTKNIYMCYRSFYSIMWLFEILPLLSYRIPHGIHSCIEMFYSLKCSWAQNIADIRLSARQSHSYERVINIMPGINRKKVLHFKHSILLYFGISLTDMSTFKWFYEASALK